ncbi:acetylglutamate kinase [Pedobacter sp. MC2016-24]|uniref:acetylglutamate kinase n=1 Tax=Pedobacter sp. MC2016-24 TaxID=2780090 RepID=UPI001882C34D|nr:acetylglutamate kinase [Pedobacter sp. MC2016-24]MBE9600572.1 acetylglutamate kinase [Pedobacter sp. MC2016-24]
MKKLSVIKIGGNVIDNSEKLHQFLLDFKALPGDKILIHGGGKIATELGVSLGVESKMVEGRRITDIETLRIVTMVYAGLINKNMVAQLQAKGCNAIGLTGADGNIIKAVKRPVKDIDYGYVGDLDAASVAAGTLDSLLKAGLVPVLCAITHDGDSQLLNTNADTIASAVAVAMSGLYDTTLIYCFEKRGVMRNIDDDNSLVPEIPMGQFETLKQEGVVSGGMIPKLHNAFEAIKSGVTAVYIGKADELPQINGNNFGTRLIK